MSLYPAPAIIEAQTWQRMPDELRQHGATSAWGQSNKVGAPVDSFLEGPSFDRDGNLWLVDIPFGRILTVSPQGDWTVRATYDGWPNGLRIHRDGRVFIADYKHGLMVLDPDTNEVTALLTHRYTESFRGCNDLVFADNGDLYFTDQGQSGLHQPDGAFLEAARHGAPPGYLT